MVNFLEKLTNDSLRREPVSSEDLLRVLNDSSLDEFDIVHSAYRIRYHYFSRDILIHVINNVQNGLCPEDCNYCAQSTCSTTPIVPYPKKEETEILQEARKAYESGAYRYCMVLSGRQPSDRTVDYMCDMIRKVKQEYPLEVCLSAGFMTEEKALRLKKAGLDRLNHNLNTSRERYPSICSTHTFDDRVETLKVAQKSGLQICSGVIVGMGESLEDIVSLAQELRSLNAESIPVNFFIPVSGNKVSYSVSLTPLFCLRVLSVFRFANPSAELRVAAGRELHLRFLQPLAFHVANSLFMEGYLNAQGAHRDLTIQMLQDNGFRIRMFQDSAYLPSPHLEVNSSHVRLKSSDHLRPFLKNEGQ